MVRYLRQRRTPLAGTLLGTLSGLMALALISAPAESCQMTSRVSLGTGGVESDGVSFQPSVSRDGRFVAFVSTSTTFVPGIAQISHVYVTDRELGETYLVSKNALGQPSIAGGLQPSISAAGRFVAFSSGASNLVPGDVNGVYDVFVVDRATGAVELASVDSSGMAGNGASDMPSISADGRYVAFISWSNNLVPGDTNQQIDAFVHDRTTGTTRRVNVSNSGAEAIYPPLGPHSPPVAGIEMAGNGRFVTYSCIATNLVPNDLNNTWDVFLHDLRNGTTQLVSKSLLGGPGNSSSVYPSISSNGRYVAFNSFASDLAAGDNPTKNDAFLWDRILDRITLVSVSLQGMADENSVGSSGVSDDGDRVVFVSRASNLVPGDTNGFDDVFVRHVGQSTTQRLSLGPAGAEANASAPSPGSLRISADGSLAVFVSLATNLVPGDTNSYYDIFVRGLEPTTAAVQGYCSSTTTSNGCLPAMSFMGEPRVTAGPAFHLTAARVPNRRNGMLLWSVVSHTRPFKGSWLCLGAPVRRTSLQGSGGSPAPTNDCSGHFSFAFSPAYVAGRGLAAGTTVYAQFHARDPAAAGRVNLSDGLEFVLAP